MRYIHKFDNKYDSTAFIKRAKANNAGESLCIAVKDKTSFIKLPKIPDTIIYDDTRENSNDKEIINTLIDNIAFGYNYDYKYDRHVILQSDLAKIDNLNSIFCSHIENGKLVYNKTTIADMSSFKYYTGITDISGIIDGKPTNFFGAVYLQTIKLPNTIKEIGHSAFAFCISLTNITLHPKLTAIKTKAFFDCINLKEITIPASVNTIEQNAFGKCEKLSKIIFKGSTPPKNMDLTIFDSINPDFKIEVPAKGLSAYKVALGTKIAAHIVEA